VIRPQANARLSVEKEQLTVPGAKVRAVALNMTTGTTRPTLHGTTISGEVSLLATAVASIVIPSI
jgi:hypothetical protein